MWHFVLMNSFPISIKNLSKHGLSGLCNTKYNADAPEIWNQNLTKDERIQLSKNQETVEQRSADPWSKEG